MATKTIMKIGAAIASSFMFVTLANAATQGAYVGVGLGGSKINADSTSMFKNNTGTTGTANSQSGGLGGKLFGGYNFNQYFGLEANYAAYARTTNKANVGSNSASAKYTMSAVSLVGKAYLPIQQFNLYALGGVAEVYSKVNYNNGSNGAITLSNSNLTLKQGSTTTRQLRPIYGVGASYDVTSHVNTGLEFSHIQGSGNTNTSAKAIPSANLLTLTAAYNFG